MPNSVIHVAGIAGTFLAAGMAVTSLVGWAYDDPDAGALALSGLGVGTASAVMWRFTEPAVTLPRLSAFTTVGFAWLYVFLVGMVPYLLAGTFDSLVNALFETVSGLTTTGSTVLPNIEEQGKGILLYRQYTQWFGGGGIVLLAVAIWPGFGVGGLELAEAEIAGPSAERLAPRVATTARRLWTIYVSLTATVVVGLLLVGVAPYDAFAHAMTTISLGGFSPFDDSVGHFDSAAVEGVLVLGMLAGGTSFALQFRAYTTGLRRFWASAEFRTYLTVFTVGLAAITLINIGDGMAVPTALRESVFNVAAILTGCGFGTSDFTAWLPSAQFLLVGLMFMGGMTGSATGGIKQLRFRVVLGHLWRDLRQARQPRGVFLVRLGKTAVPEATVARIGAFVTLYMVIVLSGTLVLTLLGTDALTAFSGVVSDIGLVGPALGEAGPSSNFLVYDEPSRLVLIMMMFLGRMELYVALLMLAAPANAVRARRQKRRARPSRQRTLLDKDPVGRDHEVPRTATEAAKEH